MTENVIPHTPLDTAAVNGHSAAFDLDGTSAEASNYDSTRTNAGAYTDQYTPTQAVVLTNATDSVDLVDHGYAVGDAVVFAEIVTTTGLTAGTTYYVSATGFGANSFRVSAALSPDTALVLGTGNGTANVRLVDQEETTGVIAHENPDTSTTGTYGLSGSNVADPAYAAPPNQVINATQPDTIVGGGSMREDADPAYRAPAGPVAVTIAETALAAGASYSGFPVRAVTFTDAGDLVGLTDHGFVAGDAVVFDDIVTTTGLTEGVRYYVRSGGLTSSAFTVAITVGGTAVVLTTNGTGTVQRATTATDVSGNADMSQVGAVVDASSPTFGVPVAPTGVTATALDNGEVRVAWTPPAQVTGAARIGYYVESSLGMSLYVAGNATSVDIQAWRIEADNPQPQTFTVRAVNKNGSGPKSTASAAVDVVNINQGYAADEFPGTDVNPVYEVEGTVEEGTGGTPNAPVIGTLVTGVGQVTANWTQSTVGSPTGYRVNVYDDSDDSLIDSMDFGDVATGLVTGLPVTAAVYVKVLALDEIEDSAESAASNVVAIT